MDPLTWSLNYLLGVYYFASSIAKAEETLLSFK
jgi:hypothetical protein